MPSPLLMLHPTDDVAIALRDVAVGEVLSARFVAVTIREPIAHGHKVAVRAIAAGAPLRKFGQTIGFAAADIAAGDAVHVHNVSLGELNLHHQPCSAVPPEPTPIVGRTFEGYRRADGRAGTRNYVAIVSTVNCSATTSKAVVQRISADVLRDYPDVDGVIALTHKGGCAFAFDGEDHRLLARTLAGFAAHPNVAASLVIGLGCETSQASYLVERPELVSLRGIEPARKASPLTLNIQDVGGVAKTTERAVAALRELLPEVNRLRREPIPVSEIVLGLNCGGSDGYSGITANPALGYASDLLVAAGGTSILAETPELFGGEHLLTQRAVTPHVAQKLLDHMQWWRDYVAKFGGTIDNNPSVGNKEGGLTTIYEKSLGAIAKGGTSALRDVVAYAERVTTRGLVIMDTPGYDPVSVTGIVAGGANVVVFTTGRGSCFGCKPTPSLKVASHSALYRRMSDDMDIDAGRVLEGMSIEELGREMFEEIIATASGKKTKSEQQGIGDEEFAPWMPGPVL